MARLEVGWLDGSLGSLTDEARRALDLARDCGHSSMHAELCAYLGRAGVEVAGPVRPPGPWAPTLAGRWREAASAWAALGERYEHAVVLASAADRKARAEGLALLQRLGAVATLPAV